MNTVLQLIVLIGGVLAASPPSGFPHPKHARLFPVCDGCHAGMIEGGAPAFPDAGTCVRCHDGARVPRVAWTAPARRTTNLRFSHGAHLQASTLARRPATCAACHQQEGGERMTVVPPQPSTCFACHGAGEHLEGGDGCLRCHTPLTQTSEWDAARITALPRPAKHGAADFLHSHGEAAQANAESCAVCHARESCERCHVNAARVPSIEALERDARVAALNVGRTGRYEAPTSHTAGWEWRHGPSAKSAGGSCANCHARASCTTCHTRDNAVTRDVPAAARGRATGVRYVQPPRVHGAGFVRSHEAAGASDASCLSCHERSSCDQCHATLRRSGFHEPNYLEQHGPAAYANELQCSSCHNTERFCRGCHTGTGRASAGRSNVVFHSATPLWLMGHGQAARQSLEGCTSCHAQADCTRCHSSRGGWGVNPHGSAFNAARLEQQSQLTCLRCHRSAELTGR